MLQGQHRGLHNFVAALRSCASKEAEQKKVNEELAKIRKKFTLPGALSANDRIKYVWKLTYVHMLGYEVDFGGIEIVNLISSVKYSEKVTGYIACSLLLSGVEDVERLMINSLRTDLNGQNVYRASLALQCIANMASGEIAENVVKDVQRLANVSNSGVPAAIRKKAYLAMLRIVRVNPSLVPADVWAPRFAKSLTKETDIGCATSLASLILGQVERSKTHWAITIPPAIQLLQKVAWGDMPAEYCYFSVPAPWLQIKLLRLLQFFSPPQDAGVFDKLMDILKRGVDRLFTGQSPSSLKVRQKSSSSKFNSELAVLFEIVNLVLHYKTTAPFALRNTIAVRLTVFANAADSNLRYLGLEALSRIAADSEIVASVRKQTTQLLAHLDDLDLSISRQALSVLYTVCDTENWQFIVDRLLETLKSRQQPMMMEELALKIAVLVERNVPDFTWYVDIVFKMIEYAPDCVSNDIWYRTVQVVTGFDGQDTATLDTLQMYSARKAYQSLTAAFSNDTLIRLAAYLIGEFGHQIVEEVSGRRQFHAVVRHWPLCGNETRAMLVLAFAKLHNSHEDVQNEILIFLEDNTSALDVEVQQRAHEFHRLLQSDDDLIEAVLGVMPTFSAGVKNNNPLSYRMKHTIAQQGRALKRDRLEVVARTEGGLLKPSTDYISTAHFKVVESDAYLDTSHVAGRSSGHNSAASGSMSSSGSSSVAVDESDSSASQTESSGRSGASSDDGASSQRSSSDDDGSVNQSASPAIPWRTLSVLPAGVIFKSDSVQVAFESVFRGSRGQVTLHFFNLLPTTPLHVHRCQSSMVNGLESYDKLPDFVLQPGGKGSAVLNMRCSSPFVNAGGQIAAHVTAPNAAPTPLQFVLPVTIGKFIQPIELDSNAFQAAWQQYAAGGDNTEVARLNSAMETVADVGRCFTAGFNLYSLQVRDLGLL
eukprot:Lankesteria_metandrocarpae@DN5135_c1_g1_i1.p1